MRFLIFFILLILFNKNIFSNEVQIIEETIGNGNEVVNHSKVTVHYIGKLEKNYFYSICTSLWREWGWRINTSKIKSYF